MRAEALTRACFVIASVLSFAFAGMLGLELRMLGFPDGYLTDFDRAKRVYYAVFGVLGIGLGLYFGYLAFYPSKGKSKRYILGLALLFAVLILCFFALHFALSLRLDRGQGA